MSLLDTLKNYEHTFTAWVAKEYKALYAAEPEIKAITGNVYKYAVPALQLAITAEGGPAAGAAFATVAAGVQQELTAANSLIYDFGPSPTAASMIANSAAILKDATTVAEVKNQQTKDIVTKVGASLTALAASVTAAVPPPQA